MGLPFDFGWDFLMFARTLTGFALVNMALRADYTSFHLSVTKTG